MKIKKLIISLLLLLTYSLGFAHNFIPHQHEDGVEDEITKEKKGHHHHHHAIKKSNHEHISHGNHYDEGLYDLLVCFLHESDNQEYKCNNHHFVLAKPNRVVINKLQVNKLVTILYSITTELEQDEKFPDYNIDSDISYLSPTIENSPHRGPPLFSC